MVIQGLVQGKNCVFQVDLGFGYDVLVCAKSFAITIETEFKETTTVGDGNYKSFEYKVLSYTISLTGLIKVTDLSAAPIFFNLAEYQQQFFPLPYKALFTDDDGNVKTITGTALIARSVFGATPNNLADTSIDLQGTGQYIFDAEALTCNASIITVGASVDPDSADPIGLIVTYSGVSGDTESIDYKVDGGGRVTISSPGTSGAFVVSGLSASPHIISIYPKCSNGLDGNPKVINIDLTAGDSNSLIDADSTELIDSDGQPLIDV